MCLDSRSVSRRSSWCGGGVGGVVVCALCTLRPRIPNSYHQHSQSTLLFLLSQPGSVLPSPASNSSAARPRSRWPGRVDSRARTMAPILPSSRPSTPPHPISHQATSHLISMSPTIPPDLPPPSNPATTHTPVPTQTRRNPRRPTHL